MGNTNSHMQQPAGLLDHQLPPAIMQHESTYQPQYPDMNQIFKGIPKMMQVADDMHRMTNYMQDLRNMMAVCSFITTIALIIFLIIRVLQNRKSTRRRRRGGAGHNNQRTDDNSEQSSLSISRPSNYRHYHSARPVDNWTHKIEMDRMIGFPPDSTSTRQTNLMMSAHGTPAGGPIAHHGSAGSHHGLMLNNNKLVAITAGNSPEHQAMHQQHSSSANHRYANNASPMTMPPHHHDGGGQNGNGTADISPCPTPTSSGHPPPILHNNAAAAPPPQQQQQHQPNGPLKRLDPVKLVVDEMPYMDNEQDQHQH